MAELIDNYAPGVGERVYDLAPLEADGTPIAGSLSRFPSAVRIGSTDYVAYLGHLPAGGDHVWVSSGADGGALAPTSVPALLGPAARDAWLATDGGNLYLYASSLSGGVATISHAESLDGGATWATTGMSLAKTSLTGTAEGNVSPAVVRIPGGSWVIFSLARPDGGERYIEYRTSTTATFSSVASSGVVALTGAPENNEIVAISARNTPGGVGLAVTFRDAAGNTQARFAAVSPDFATATVSANDLLPRTSSWYSQLGRVDFGFLPVPGAEPDLSLWFEGYSAMSGLWAILHEVAHPIADMTPPPAPSVPTLVRRASTLAEISWTPPVAEVAFYRVVRAGVVVGYATEARYVDTTVAPSRTYTYRVEAVSLNGVASAPSGPLSVTTLTPPPVPPTQAAGSLDGSPMGTTPTARLVSDRGAVGPLGNVDDVTYTEDASPTCFTDSKPGVGGLSMSIGAIPGIKGTDGLRQQVVDLYDPRVGIQRGIVGNITTLDEFSVDVELDTVLVKTVAEREAKPYTGSLGGAIRYYLSLCGIESGIVIDEEYETIPVALPSWSTEVWAQLKKLAALYSFEIAAVADSVRVRKLRQFTIDPGYEATVTRKLTAESPSSLITASYQNNVWKERGTLWPDVKENILNRQIISVDSSEKVVTNLKVNAYVTSVMQPTHVLNLPEAIADGQSSYSVVDKDGVSVSPFDWANGGGKVTVEIGKDGESLDVTIVGMSTNDSRAPYKIASTSVDGEYQFSSLSIAGSGVFHEVKEVSFQTGLVTENVPIQSETNIKDPLISTPAQAWTAALDHSREASGELQRITMISPYVTRRPIDGLSMYPTFDEIDLLLVKLNTFAEFDVILGLATFSEIDHQWAELRGETFESQALGQMAGARYRYGDSVYRMTDVSVRFDGFTWDGIDDLLFEELDERIGLDTFTAYDVRLGDRTFSELNVAPLSP